MASQAETIRVELKKSLDDSYDIVIGEGEIARAPGGLMAEHPAEGYVVICDHTTKELFGNDFETALTAAGAKAFSLSVVPGEDSKSLDVFGGLLEAMRERRVTRNYMVVALGGGVVGDLAGYTAGCYMRGIPFVQVPTTLLAQVDSSVGGKVAVNIRGGKNYCGLFYQPRKVYIDVAALRTLSEAEVKNGLAELVKHAIIADPELGRYLLDHAKEVLALEADAMTRVVARSCRIKADVVQRDEREGGLRMILNYGHTIGHALEDAFNHAMPHGECVAYGMRVEARASNLLGHLPDAELKAHDALLDAFGLAVKPLAFSTGQILDLTLGDKKTGHGKVRYVLPTALGKVFITHDVDESALRQALATIQA